MIRPAEGGPSCPPSGDRGRQAGPPGLSGGGISIGCLRAHATRALRGNRAERERASTREVGRGCVKPRPGTRLRERVELWACQSRAGFAPLLAALEPTFSLTPLSPIDGAKLARSRSESKCALSLGLKTDRKITTEDHDR